MASAVASPVLKMAAITGPACTQQGSVARCEGLKLFPSLKTKTVFSVRRSPSRGRLHITCAKADSATVETVKNVICKQLAMEPKDVLPDSKFADLGADSLDTVEIMMALEEQFEISLSQDGAEKITTVQDAADLIHEICNSKTPSA